MEYLLEDPLIEGPKILTKIIERSLCKSSQWRTQKGLDSRPPSKNFEPQREHSSKLFGWGPDPPGYAYELNFVKSYNFIDLVTKLDSHAGHNIEAITTKSVFFEIYKAVVYSEELRFQL